MRSRRHLLLRAACWLLACLVTAAGSASAQGPAYRERWGYLHLERRRAELFDELAGRSEADVRAVAELLAASDGGVPFVPVANALAFLRGCEPDAAFQLRCALGLFVLPEVVDPDGKQPACRVANFSVMLPFSLPPAGRITFEVSISKPSGERIHVESLSDKTDLEDVRLAQARLAFPCDDLADGAYEVELRTLLDGAGPRAADPGLRWTFHVLRGYQERAELAMGGAVAVRADLDPLRRALLDGCAAEVSRAYTGEAFAVRSDAVQDLLRLERCLQNLAEDRPPLSGLRGVVPTGLPFGDSFQPCLLRAHPDGGPRPTVVFAPGAPAYGIGARRPASPPFRSGAWLSRELGAFGLEDGWNVCVLGSPGGGRPYAAAVRGVLESLPALLATDGPKPVLVCDREAAAVVGIQLAKLRPLVSGVVLIGAGAIPAPTLRALEGLPVRTLKLSGYPASVAIDRLMDYVAGQAQNERDGLDLELLHERPTPWPYGAASSAAELRAFARRCFEAR